jgi:CubicO group peptidase (beta-lactamase class C family)
VPRDLLAGALLRPYGNGYAGYGTDRLLRALARTRTRHAPGTHWHYSNFGLALLGPAMEHATGTDYGTLLAARVLRPLGLTAGTATAGTSTGATGDTPEGFDATGYRGDGRTPLPPTDMAGFAPAGAVRATPADLLTYAEALLSVTSAGPNEPTDTASPTASPLTAALHDVQVPQLRRGFGRRHTHTLTWYQHPAPGGPLLFHAGATFGHQSFLGFQPSSGTAVAAVATRHDRACRLVTSGYDLLHDLCGPGTSAPRSAPGSATPS